MARRAAEKGPLESRQVVIRNMKGLHARPAAKFVKATTKFNGDVFVEKDGERVNGKSIMGLMMLAAGPGSRLTLYAEGDDAEKLLRELESLVQNEFEE